MEIKQPITYIQQMEKLRSRGCQISDEDKCTEILRNVNYYRLTAYFLPFKQSDDTYLSGTTIEQVYCIYEFDRRLRRILFSAIEEIEIKLRTTIAYFHSHKYGSLGYQNSDNFNQLHRHEKFMQKMNTEIQQNKNVLYVKHHLENYEGKFPLWVAVELFTFGMLSCFYADLKRSDQRIIANNNFEIESDVLKSWLRCCTDLRNICAHYGRLYNRRFPTRPKTPEDHFELENKLFDFIVALKHLYPNKERWNNETLLALKALIDEYEDSIKLNHIGFPSDWNELLNNK
ncbi:Abortive infection bacteriophage resistance protein [Sporobacter termitidis DSM 10068]|uniref:Abortive infection bacteriophage resistance protein n=1 Tax=Sporobacter termitidis DSM 10068 TaxID=1123282 RepID=A0A1M5ZIM7_9FIRM|nr:Abi family protein [Sporobacter termitidis]SHI24175.1 Abortive infection bacteriophage resistance protein [Sporobacter termitidis DSM 10068]